MREPALYTDARANSRSIAARERSTSASVVDQLETEIRMNRRPRHVVPPIQHVPSRCTAGDDLIGPLVGAEAHKDLIEDDVVGYLDLVDPVELLAEAPG